MSRQPLSDILPPLICGTATFNTQYNVSVADLPTRGIIARALNLGVRAFDTSPYYGPSESLLGDALSQPSVRKDFPRESYMLLTKCGRIGPSEFDYSAAWTQKSVSNSLARLQTTYLDVVYCHDVEFVTPDEVVTAVRELRRLRDTDGTVKYVGISAYPVSVLVELAEKILCETGEPIDIVQSYSNFNVQNTRLLSEGLGPLAAAGVDVVTNASVLNMGLLRQKGVPEGGQGDWHPAPKELRSVVASISKTLDEQGEKLEKIAIRYAVETWMKSGSQFGSRGDPALGDVDTTITRPVGAISPGEPPRKRLGVSVMGVSQVEELDETMRVWRSVLLTRLGDEASEIQAKIKSSYGDLDGDYHDIVWGRQRRNEVIKQAELIKTSLGKWYNFAWSSPHEGFVISRPERSP